VSLPPIRSWLYAPGNNAKLLDRVLTAGADAVILDLEDAVPPSEKARARSMVAAAVGARGRQPGPCVFVRVNHPLSGLASEDIEAVVCEPLDGIRLPKVEDAATVTRVDDWLSRAETDRGLPNGQVAIVCGIESALGLWNAVAIASASPRVMALSFGTVDFASDVSASVGPEGLESLYARSRLVIASRVAGIRPPVDGVYANIRDDAGLERLTCQSRDLGFFGRSALHPRQVPIINAVFTPVESEVAWAQAVVEAAHAAEQTGSGAVQLENGDFVDVAVVRRAEHILHLKQSLPA
jgi:citrate lyase subunit beta / citryl-CoA lyase